MTRDSEKFEPAKLDWPTPMDRDAQGGQSPAPRSIFFDDIYFSGDGPAETTHVFLQGNNLPQRWEMAPRFTIGELGFGTGLNFLTAWDAWRNASKPETAQLHVISFEAFPLETEEIKRAHAAWPQFADLSAKLRAALPPLQPGVHQCHLDEETTLTLCYGDALKSLKGLEATIDAWFFDGFSPAKNPAMWAPAVFAQCARLSAPGTSFSTFTVAGSVRRALQQAGFSIEKRPGFGRKREMLAGEIDQPPNTTNRTPWFHCKTAPHTPGARIAIIGGGIAGASLAYALRREGLVPVLYESKTIASGASGNPAGLIMPRLDNDDTPTAQFFIQSYFHCLSILNTIRAQEEGIFSPCGAFLHGTNDKSRTRNQAIYARGALPQLHIEVRDGNLFFPHGGVIDPARYVHALLGDTEVRNTPVLKLSEDNGCWSVETPNGTDKADAVIIANGVGALKFSQARSLPLIGSAGQIDWFEQATAPEHAHVFGPYIAPAPNGGAVIGATYAPITISEEPAFTKEATETNIAAIGRHQPEVAACLRTNASHPRASVRCTTPDQMPVAGPVPDWGYYSGAYDGLRNGIPKPYPMGKAYPNLYIMSGLGSRGLVTAPLVADFLATLIAGTPSPITAAVAETLHPARFFIRDLKRPNPRH